MSTQGWIFLGYVLLLAGMLFFPVSKLVWVLSVRRLEKRLQQPIGDVERRAQQRRAQLVSLALVLAFSLLFNVTTLGVIPAQLSG